MLISKEEIGTFTPPFILRTATGKWTLVSKVIRVESNLKLEIIENKNGNFCVRSIDLKEEPFYVGEGVWELEYGSVIMSLNHQSLDDHPANALWTQWLSANKKV